MWREFHLEHYFKALTRRRSLLSRRATSAVRPEGPGAAPFLARLKLASTTSGRRWAGSSGWNSRTGGSSAWYGCAGRRAGSRSSAKVSGAWGKRGGSERLPRSRQLAKVDEAVHFVLSGLGCRRGKGCLDGLHQFELLGVAAFPTCLRGMQQIARPNLVWAISSFQVPCAKTTSRAARTTVSKHA